MGRWAAGWRIYKSPAFSFTNCSLFPGTAPAPEWEALHAVVLGPVHSLV